jgi:UDP-glucose 4-epimerase
MIQEVTGRHLNVVDKERRPGDADTLIADVTKIKNELGFEPQHSDLRSIIDSAWKWHSSRSEENKT